MAMEIQKPNILKKLLDILKELSKVKLVGLLIKERDARVNIIYCVTLASFIFLLGIALLFSDRRSLMTPEVCFLLSLISFGVLFVSSILLPQFQLQTEVENELRSDLEKEIKKQCEKIVSTGMIEAACKDILSTVDIVKGELKWTDAHISRVVAFLFEKDNNKPEHMWAINWYVWALKQFYITLMTLKRYQMPLKRYNLHWKPI